MSKNPAIGTPPDLQWDAQSRPTASRFGDSYFSTDPVGEVRHVFLQGTGLPDMWDAAGGPRIIGETGFGTGLNFLMLWDLWRRAPHAPNRICFASAEAWPLTREQMARAHAAFPELADLSAALLAQWPEAGLSQGRYLFSFEQGCIQLNLIVDEAVSAIQSLAVPGGVQVWFLDGFAPSRNPDMWTPALFTALAKQSAPKARLATFTAVGEVRRQLGYAGFAVERVPGFGRKRHMSRAVYEGQVWPHWAQPPMPATHGTPSIAIVGAGIAGLSLALALQERGHNVSLFEKAKSLGAGASGLPCALLMPRPDLGSGLRARLAQDAFRYADEFWQGCEDVYCRTGVIHHPKSDREAKRFESYAAQSSACAWDGEALHHSYGGTINAPAALRLLLQRFESAGGESHFDCRFAPEHVAEFDQVVWAIGAYSDPVSRALVPYRMMAGEMVTVVRQTSRPEVSHSHIAGLDDSRSVVGASFYECSGAEDLPPPDPSTVSSLAQAWHAQPEQIWQGVRATLPDQLPVVGPMVHQQAFQTHFAPLKDGPFAAPKGDIPFLTGQYLFNGLGARGFQLGPYLAQHVADMIEGRVASLPLGDLAGLHPARFVVRQIIKGA